MNYIAKLFIVTMLFSSFCTSAQEGLSSSTREITLGVGLSLVSLQDNRYSALKYKSIVPNYHIGFRKYTSTTRQEFNFSFSMHTRTKSDRLLSLKFMRPNFSYSLQKKIGDTWLGGYFNHNTLLTYPSSKTGHFNNSPLSYTMANSIGPKVTWSKGLTMRDQNRFLFDASAEAALVNYVIRPAFGHPYPSAFLESGTFTPTRKGMTGPLLRSGKLLTINKFNSFKIVLRISYFINNDFRLGINFQFENSRIDDVNTSSISNQEVLLSLSYQY